MPHHYAHVEYILHYSNLSPGIVLIIDGSGSKEKDRKYFNIYEKESSECISHVNTAGKETISAYWFDGKSLLLIYRLSPPVAISEKCNQNSNGFLQSIGHYWRWASNYCCGSHSEAGKVMGLSAFGDPNVHKNLKKIHEVTRLFYLLMILIGISYIISIIYFAINLTGGDVIIGTLVYTFFSSIPVLILLIFAQGFSAIKKHLEYLSKQLESRS